MLNIITRRRTIMRTKSRLILGSLVVLLPVSSMAQQKLTEEQQSVYQILKEFDERMPSPFSLSEGYLENLATSADEACHKPARKAEGEKTVRVVNIGEGEQLSDLLDVAIDEIDSLKLTGHVHQKDFELIRGNLYPKGHSKYDPSLPMCYDYRLSGIDLSECEIEDDSIPSYAFSAKASLQFVRLPEGLEEICHAAFYRAKSLGSLTFPTTLKRLGPAAFAEAGLTDVNLPESVESIGEMCFYGESRVKRFTMAAAPLECGNNLFLQSSVEEACLPDNMEQIYVGMFQHTPLKSVTIPEGVKTIGEGVFNFCIFLKTELPESIEHIGSKAFAGNVSAKEFVIPDNVESIDSLAFFNSGLRCVTIGESVKSIGLGCFSQNKLEYVYCKSMQPPFVPDAVEGSQHLVLPFDNNPSRAKQKDVLLVPKGTKELYENAFCWKDFTEIIEVDGDESAREKMAEHTGILNISSERALPFNVYTMDGVHMPTDSLSDLPAGIYIVNGKKYVVR